MNLTEWLRSTGTTQAAFAAQLGVVPSTISRICRHETQPDGALIERIAQVTAGAVMPNDLFPRAVQAAQDAAVSAQAAE